MSVADTNQVGQRSLRWHGRPVLQGHLAGFLDDCRVLQLLPAGIICSRQICDNLKVIFRNEPR